MSAPLLRTRRLALAALIVALAAALAGASDAHGEGSSVGATVESTLALSLGEPSPLTPVRTPGGYLYTARIAVKVTATEAPIRLSVADGEALGGRRLGHLERGASILAAPLQAAAGHGSYRSLDRAVDPVLEQWGEPVSLAGTTIQLRQSVPGAHQPPVGDYHKLLLVTVTAAGP